MFGVFSLHRPSIWNGQKDASITYTSPTVVTGGGGGGGSSFVSGTTGAGMAPNQKIYYEFTVTATGNNAGMGFQNINAPTWNYGGSDTNGCSLYFGGAWSYGSSQFYSGAPAPATGNVCSVAIDGINTKIWVRINGGNWNLDVIGNQNPATNTGGFSCPSAFSLPIYIGYTSNNSTSEIIVLNAGSTAFSYTPPVGFRSPNSCLTN